MKTTSGKRLFSLVLAMIMVAAAISSTYGDNMAKEEGAQVTDESASDADQDDGLSDDDSGEEIAEYDADPAEPQSVDEGIQDVSNGLSTGAGGTDDLDSIAGLIEDDDGVMEASNELAAISGPPTMTLAQLPDNIEYKTNLGYTQLCDMTTSNGGVVSDDLLFHYSSLPLNNPNVEDVKGTIPGEKNSLGDLPLGTYTLQAKAKDNPDLFSNVIVFSVVPKRVVVPAINYELYEKVYDGTTAATFTLALHKGEFTLRGLDGSEIRDEYLYMTVVGEFEDKNAQESYKKFFINDLVLTEGPDGPHDTYKNYDLDVYRSVKYTQATIVPFEITEITGLTAKDKVYDGTKEAELDGSKAKLFRTEEETLKIPAPEGDDVSISGKGEFSGQDAGDGPKQVSVSALDLVLTGKDAQNYTLNNNVQPEEVTAKITPRPVTVKDLKVLDKEYDGDKSATIKEGWSFENLVGEEELSATVNAAFDDQYAGKDKPVTVSFELETVSGKAGNPANYSCEDLTTTADIEPRPVVVSGIKAYDKDYDGSPDAELDFEEAEIKYAKNPEEKGIIRGDQVWIDYDETKGVFAKKEVELYRQDPDAGEDKTVWLYKRALTGDDADNYELSSMYQQETTTATINKAKLRVVTPGSTKVYDGMPLIGEGYLEGLVWADGAEETVGFTVTGKQTIAGTSKNTYDKLVFAAEGNDYTAKEGNYEVVEDIGDLTVIPSRQQVILTTNDGVYTYDGQPHGATVTVGNLPAGYSVKEIEYIGKKYTNVTDTPGKAGYATDVSLVIVDVEGNDVTAQLNKLYVPGTITIVPADNKVTVAITGWTEGKYDKKKNAPAADAEYGEEKAQFVYGESPYGPFSAAVPTKAGTYYVKAIVPKGDNYRKSESVPAKFRILQAQPTAAEKAAAETSINKKLKMYPYGSRMNLQWGRVKNADGYDIYVTYCFTDFPSRPYKTVSSQTSSLKITELYDKNLSPKKDVKAYVVAWRKVNGVKTELAKSMEVHTAGNRSKKYTNSRKATTNADKFSLAKGGTAKIRTKLVKKNASKALMPKKHVSKVRYLSSDKSVATVDGYGKIKAVGKGNCKILIYSASGYVKAIRLTVK